EQETAGLKELLARGQPRIFASPEGLDAVKAMCPPGTVVLSTVELKDKGGLSVTPIPLAGRGIAPVAYLLQWSNKSVLISGRIPVLIDQDSREELLSKLMNSKSNAIAYIESIQRLVNVQPDLWLPAVSINGQ